jgi:hypothetical protein
VEAGSYEALLDIVVHRRVEQSSDDKRIVDSVALEADDEEVPHSYVAVLVALQRWWAPTLCQRTVRTILTKT